MLTTLLTRGSDRRHWAATMAAALAALALFSSVPGAHAANCRAMAAPSVDWEECDKSKLVLPGSNLDHAKLFGTDLSYTDLRHSSFSGATLEKATLIRSSLAGSKAEKANFSRIEGYRTIFTEVSAPQASFVSAELQRADFSDADLTGADFEKAELGRAILANATITGSRFAMANLSRVHLNQAKFEGPIDYSGAFLFLTRIEGMDLSQATGLQQWQIEQACGDASTKLPAGLQTPPGWPCSPDD
jgi:uncharacterized protein YjbI with pentapeptide repeats